VRPGRDADPSPPSSAEVKNRAVSLLSLRAFVAYERMNRTCLTSHYEYNEGKVDRKRGAVMKGDTLRVGTCGRR